MASEQLPCTGVGWKSRRCAGRPAIRADIRDLILTISRDNPLWGAPEHLLVRQIRVAIARMLDTVAGIDASAGDSALSTPGEF
jgi:hypothetical protein